MSSPRLLGISCFLFPILAGLAWLVTLVLMITIWVNIGSPHYPEMFANQSLAYISNVGASQWGRPLFISGSAITAFFFLTTIAIERWLRYRGRLIHAGGVYGACLSTMAGICTVLGTSGMVVLTICDVRMQPHVHYSMVALFVFSYLFAASFMCAEKRLLSAAFPTNNILRLSFRIKLFFIITEIILAVISGVTMYERHYVASVVGEWLIGLFFALYMLSFAIDFMATPELIEKELKPVWEEEHWVPLPAQVYVSRRSQYYELP